MNHLKTGNSYFGAGSYVKYKFGGKELQETGMYDFGARMYMADIGRWFAVDPLNEKYLNTSPFVYAVNNPLRYIDPDGRKIEDSNQIVKNYKTQISENVDNIKKFIDQGLVSPELGGKLLSFYNTILDEIIELETSSQIYNVYLNSSMQGGATFYNLSKNEVSISIGDNSIGVVGHELKHASQFESGAVSLMVDDLGYGRLYDITDETESYNRERALTVGKRFFESPETLKDGYPLKMNDQNVRDFGKANNIISYEGLKNGPIDINSEAGKQLIQKTIIAGENNTKVDEVYKGWENDFKKGQQKKIK